MLNALSFKNMFSEEIITVRALNSLVFIYPLYMWFVVPLCAEYLCVKQHTT